ncbi:MAG TPA: folylpolyglutamate synthase/dihydrofolate synthase family protein [bacterium]|nr:folylpolyglutamate synthase/dihydrofolate synthase family protein [bacterium]
MLYHDAVSYLSRFTNYERELRYPYDGWHLNLERVRVLLDELGSPERDLPVIHVAGTKGKGSTAAMIEAMARAAGFKTGLYTSPHLLDFKERIRIGGRMIGESDVADMVERMAPAIERVHGRIELGPLTYFEIITAMALAVFARERVDVAVLEAGLGGRFDATNVCNPLVTVLTAVSMDHTDILGDTLEAIAGEKAQIIKAGKPAVIAPQQEAVYGVFRARCEEAGAREIRVAERCRWRQTREDAEGQWADIEGAVKLPELFIALTGEHQLQNAATALVAVDEASRSGITVGVEAMRRGLSSLVWPGRFQRIRRKPDVVLDGAHNGASAEYLARSIRKIYPGRRVTAVIGMGGDKDVEGFCAALGPAIHSVILTRSRAKKALPANRFKKALAPFHVRVLASESVAEAMERALKGSAPDDVVLVTGSFYVVGEALEWDGGEGAALS